MSKLLVSTMPSGSTRLTVTFLYWTYTTRNDSNSVGLGERGFRNLQQNLNAPFGDSIQWIDRVLTLSVLFQPSVHNLANFSCRCSTDLNMLFITLERLIE